MSFISGLMSLMKALSFFLWILPELVALLFVVGWPAVYRTLSKPLLDEALKSLGVVEKEKARAFGEYQRDLNLATIATIVTLVTFSKFLVVLKYVTDVTVDPNVSGGSVVIYCLVMLAWLAILHGKVNPRDYLQESGSNKRQLFKKVAGRWPAAVFWTRLVLAATTLGFSIWTGFQFIL